MKRLLASGIVALLCVLNAAAGTVTGQVQNAQQGPLPNGTFTFTLTQFAVVSGSATVVSSPVNCFTDQFGNVVGEPNPLVGPVLSSNLASGTLAAATYYVKITYIDASGESFPSPETSLNLASAGTLIITAPTRQPANATGYKVYIGTSSGAETLQGTITGTPGSWANFSQSSALSAGSALPASNTTACKIRFNDELQPSFVCYNVGLTTSLGAAIPGYPQFWYLAGGSAGTVNLSLGTPSSTVCNGAGVFYPQSILTNPAFNATQSINGGLNLNGFPLIGASATFTSLNGINFATSSTIQTSINTACNGTIPGIAWMPVGSFTGIAAFQIPNNCTVKCPSPWGCKLTLANSANTTFITQKSAVASNIVIEDMILDGNQANETGTSSCIYMQSVNGVHIRHNKIQNCLTHAVWVDGTGTASQNVWVEDNSITSPVNGHGILMGNGPSPSNTVVINPHIRGNIIQHTTSSLVNGIFILGAASVGTCGTGQGDITNNIINGATDTGIEVGQGSCQVAVIGNNITLGAVNGTTGIGIRSAQEVTVVGNQVHGNGTNTTQVCYLFWNNAGNDDLKFASVVASGNLGKGCTAASSFDVQVNLGTAGARGVGDHFKMVGFETDGGTGSYNYLGNPTNFYRCGNDDGGFCTSNEGGDYTFDVGSSGGFIHLIAPGTGKVGIGAATFSPGTPLHIQDGNGGVDVTLEDTGNSNKNLEWKNTTQAWDLGIRAASSNCSAEALLLRDKTNSLDVFCISPSSGNVAQTGLTSRYNNIATAGNGLAATYAQSDQIAQNSNIGSSNLITGGAATGGHYVINFALYCTTSDASGASVVINIAFTSEGVSRTSSSSSVALASTANATQAAFPLNADNSTNISWSTTVTGAPTTGKYAAHIWISKQ